jgi:hypothetical protein
MKSALDDTFNQKTNIKSVKASIFSFGVRILITGLIPNERYQIWLFSPDQEAMK